MTLVLPPRARSSTKLLFTAVFAAAALWLGSFVFVHSVDVPRADDWYTPGQTVLAWTRGTNPTEQLDAQHNESRPLTGRVVLGTAAILTGWNSRWLHAINTAVIIATASIVLRLAVRSLRPHNLQTGILLVVASLSATQWRNALWSVQFIVVCCPLLVITSLACNARPSQPAILRYGCAAAASWLATFSFAIGLAAWLVCWPGWRFVVDRGPWEPRCRVLDISFACACLATVAWYFLDYRSPGSGFVTGFGLPHWTAAAFALWAFLPLMPPAALTDPAIGILPSLLGHGAVLAVLFGSAGVWLAVSAVRAVVTTAADDRGDLYPWLGLTVFGCIAGLATAAGRANAQDHILCAFADRYSTFALTLHLGLLGLVHSGPRRPHVISLALYATALLAGNVFAWRAAGADAEQRRLDRLTVSTIELLPENRLTGRLHAQREDVVTTYSTLRRAGFFTGFVQHSWLAEFDLRTDRRWTSRVLCEPLPFRRAERLEIEIRAPDGEPTPQTPFIALVHGDGSPPTTGEFALIPTVAGGGPASRRCGLHARRTTASAMDSLGCGTVERVLHASRDRRAQVATPVAATGSHNMYSQLHCSPTGPRT